MYENFVYNSFLIVNFLLIVIVNNIFKVFEFELEYNGMFILDEFLNISKDIMEFVGWLEVCIFLNIFNLCLIIVFCWIVF